MTAIGTVTYIRSFGETLKKPSDPEGKGMKVEDQM
jgi:hypothetical protein